MTTFDRAQFPPDLKGRMLARALVDAGLAASGEEGISMDSERVWINGVPAHRAAELAAFVASYVQGPEPPPTRVETATVIPSPTAGLIGIFTVSRSPRRCASRSRRACSSHQAAARG